MNETQQEELTPEEKEIMKMLCELPIEKIPVLLARVERVIDAAERAKIEAEFDDAKGEAA